MAAPVRLLQRIPDTELKGVLLYQKQLLERARLLMAGNTACAPARAYPFVLVAVDVGASRRPPKSSMRWCSKATATLPALWLRKSGANITPGMSLARRCCKLRACLINLLFIAIMNANSTSARSWGTIVTHNDDMAIIYRYVDAFHDEWDLTRSRTASSLPGAMKTRPVCRRRPSASRWKSWNSAGAGGGGRRVCHAGAGVDR